MNAIKLLGLGIFALLATGCFGDDIPPIYEIPDDELSPESVRKAIAAQPQNIGLLARMAVGKLAKAAEGKGSMLPAEKEGVLAAASLLSRLLPILFESERPQWCQRAP